MKGIFYTKFNGNQRDCCRELGRFLLGDVKEAYDALGGSAYGYRDMREKILQWYKSQRVGRSYKNKAELQQASMREGETFKLYCMRLEQIAYRAYPNNKYACAKQLKKKHLFST